MSRSAIDRDTSLYNPNPWKWEEAGCQTGFGNATVTAPGVTSTLCNLLCTIGHYPCPAPELANAVAERKSFMCLIPLMSWLLALGEMCNSPR